MTDPPRDVAISFGRALTAKNIEHAVELFEPDATPPIIDRVTSEQNLPLSEDIEFFLRRLRCSMHALRGEIADVAVSQVSGQADRSSPETPGDTTVLLSFECAHESQQLAVHLDTDGSIVDLAVPDEYVPPAYADQSTFEEQSLTIDADGVELDAVATVPTGVTEPPIAVLVPGAGPTDKDDSVGPNRFFQDLAWGLATEGIATLRYDKREAVVDLPPAERTLERLYFSDGVRAAERAAAIDDVDEDAVFVLGHSLGGRCAFELASRYGDACGVAALDPNPTKPMEGDSDLRAMLEVDGMVPPQFEQLIESYQQNKEQFHEKRRGDSFEPEDAFLRSMWEYDQFETAASLSIPIFLSEMQLYETAWQTHASRWDDVLADRDTRYRRPNLNHSFQRGQPPRSALEGILFHKSVDSIVIEDLADWIDEWTTTAGD